ncbi:patatin-like phospholipase family protein [Microbulbifer sp. PAAF003]|uniref:patatin-like phospholipase family protein n=1 Tax=Microbulbifer sp. PAAF003 TaxID=3243375 RepID=UPI004039B5C0
MELSYFLIICTVIIVIFTACAYLYNYILTASATFYRSPVQEDETAIRNHLIDKDTINILVIDGGGIRGLIPLYVIKHLEKALGQPVDELFDVFSGVSTGAVIVTGLNVRSSHLAKNYANVDSKTDLLINLYKSKSNYLFSTPWYHKLLTASGLFSPKYLGRRLHKVMEKHYTPELNFTDLKNYVIIPSLSVNTGELHLFKNRGGDTSELPTNSLYQLVTAAVSGVSLFPPVGFMADSKEVGHKYFADAGISANNPASVALLDIIKEFPHKNYYVLILGSGTSPLNSSQVKYKDLKNWGILQWARDAISSVQRSMDEQQLHALEIASLLSNNVKIKYDYLNVEVTEPHVGLFEYDNIDSLKIHSDRLIKNNKQKIQQVIDQLATANG